jgi:transposase
MPEWALVEPMITPAKRGGRRREVNVREVLNAIFYVLSTGCQWQALPAGDGTKGPRLAPRCHCCSKPRESDQDAIRSGAL